MRKKNDSLLFGFLTAKTKRKKRKPLLVDEIDENRSCGISRFVIWIIAALSLKFGQCAIRTAKTGLLRL